MENITKEFTYNIADDQYYQKNDNKKTATLTYTGPAKKFLIVNTADNKLQSGVTISEEQYETFNDTNIDQYAVEVDCDKDTLICALVENSIDLDSLQTISEPVPGSDIDYVRSDPPSPDHTYEISEIVYDKSNNSFVTPLPWKKPYVYWIDLLSWRNRKLINADRTLSEDLPTSLYTQVSEYKQYLRDFPATFGAAFSVAISSAGTGYSVGDRFLVNDPAYKNGQSAPDILLTITEVSSTGEITSVTKTTTNAYDYHPEAGTYENVFYTTSSAGSGANFTLSKVKTVDPWKITPKENPLA